jgi:peptidoglycan/LPS O-acetylase OafA/YrhL
MRPERSLTRALVPGYLDVSLIAGGLAPAVVWWHTGGYRAVHPAAVSLSVPGRVAVQLFLIISDYVIGSGFVHGRYVLTSRGLAAFYRNRLLRIYPLLLVSAVAVALTTAGGQSLPPAATLLRETLVLQWWHEYHLVGVFWTLGISNGMYAWHGLVLVYFPGFVDAFWLTLAVSTVLAFASYVLVERPSLRLKAHGQPCRPPATGAALQAPGA